MQPQIALDERIVRDNAVAWRTFANVAVRAVVKAEGYGWGYAPLVHALDDVVSGYCVADADELRAVRALTNLPIATLGSEPARIAEIFALHGIPTVTTAAEIETARDCAGHELRLRIGVVAAAGWSGVSLSELQALAPVLVRNHAAVELWTHVTAAERYAGDLHVFEQALEMLRHAGVAVVETDLLSTLPLARFGSKGSSARIGAGLFGATGGADIPGVRCALSVRAPVVRETHCEAGTPVGYGDAVFAAAERVVTARCGYADGISAALGGDTVLSVGMQYLTARAAAAPSDEVVLLDQSSSLDAFAARSSAPVHQIITALGNRVRARRVTEMV